MVFFGVVKPCEQTFTQADQIIIGRSLFELTPERLVVAGRLRFYCRRWFVSALPPPEADKEQEQGGCQRLGKLQPAGNVQLGGCGDRAVSHRSRVEAVRLGGDGIVGGQGYLQCFFFQPGEIGRASCRERVLVWRGGGAGVCARGVGSSVWWC